MQSKRSRERSHKVYNTRITHYIYTAIHHITHTRRNMFNLQQRGMLESLWRNCLLCLKVNILSRYTKEYQKCI